MSFIWPTLLDYYVYGEPVFMFTIFSLIIIPYYIKKARQWNRRLIIEQPT